MKASVALAAVDLTKELDTNLTKNCDLFREQINEPVADVAAFAPEQLESVSFERFQAGRLKGVRIWCRLTLNTIGPASASRTGYMLIDNLLADYIDVFYRRANGKWSRLGKAGDRRPLSDRWAQLRHAVFPMDLVAGESLEFVISLSSNRLMYSPIRLMDLTGVIRFVREHELFNGLLFGIAIGLFLFNLVIFLFSRQWRYIQVIILCLPPTLVTFCQELYPLRYFIEESPDWQHNILAAVISLSIFMVGIAGLSLLELKEPAKLRGFIRIVAWFALFVATLGLAGLYQAALLMAAVISLFMAASLMILAFYHWYRGHRFARWLIVIWSPLFVTAVMMSLDYFHVISSNFWSIYGFRVAGILQFGMVTYVMTVMIRSNQVEVQQKEIESQVHQNISQQTKNMQAKLIGFDDEGSEIQYDYHYEPNLKTGGDWFHGYYWPKTDVMFFLIGDVSGHGVKAALITSFVAGAVESRVTFQQPLAGLSYGDQLLTILTDINDFIHRTNEAHGMFMTMQAFALDCQERQIHSVNAGHHPALLWTEGKIKTIHQRGSALGLHATPHFKTLVTPFASQSRLFCYTDGLVEVTSSRGFLPLRRVLKKFMENSDNQRPVRDLVAVIDEQYRDELVDDDRCLVALVLP